MKATNYIRWQNTYSIYLHLIVGQIPSQIGLAQLTPFVPLQTFLKKNKKRQPKSKAQPSERLIRVAMLTSKIVLYYIYPPLI